MERTDSIKIISKKTNQVVKAGVKAIRYFSSIKKRET